MANDFMNFKFFGPEDPAYALRELKKGDTAVFGIERFNQVIETIKDLGYFDGFVMRTMPEAMSILIKKI